MLRLLLMLRVVFGFGRRRWWRRRRVLRLLLRLGMIFGLGVIFLGLGRGRWRRWRRRRRRVIINLLHIVNLLGALVILLVLLVVAVAAGVDRVVLGIPSVIGSVALDVIDGKVDLDFAEAGISGEFIKRDAAFSLLAVRVEIELVRKLLLVLSESVVDAETTLLVVLFVSLAILVCVVDAEALTIVLLAGLDLGNNLVQDLFAATDDLFVLKIILGIVRVLLALIFLVRAALLAQVSRGRGERALEKEGGKTQILGLHFRISFFFFDFGDGFKRGEVLKVTVNALSADVDEE